MHIFAETDRLILREIVPEDREGIFQLDAAAEVHQYLGNHPITDITEADAQIAYIRKQYQVNGIGRWAVIKKDTAEFLGWSGLKLNEERVNNRTNYYDIGYRLISKYWGLGYATESATVALRYGFEKLKLPVIYGIADLRNKESRNVLQKIGLLEIEEFDLEGDPHVWMELSRGG